MSRRPWTRPCRRRRQGNFPGATPSPRQMSHRRERQAISTDDAPPSPDNEPSSPEIRRLHRRRAVVARDTPSPQTTGHPLQRTRHRPWRRGNFRGDRPSSPEMRRCPRTMGRLQLQFVGHEDIQSPRRRRRKGLSCLVLGVGAVGSSHRRSIARSGKGLQLALLRLTRQQKRSHVRLIPGRNKR